MKAISNYTRTGAAAGVNPLGLRAFYLGHPKAETSIDLSILGGRTLDIELRLAYNDLGTRRRDRD